MRENVCVINLNQLEYLYGDGGQNLNLLRIF
jgi:hypothetical protein